MFRTFWIWRFVVVYFIPVVIVVVVPLRFGRRLFEPLPIFYYSPLWSNGSFDGESIRNIAGTPNYTFCTCNWCWIFSLRFRSTCYLVDFRRFYAVFVEHSMKQKDKIVEALQKASSGEDRFVVLHFQRTWNQTTITRGDSSNNLLKYSKSLSFGYELFSKNSCSTFIW